MWSIEARHRDVKITGAPCKNFRSVFRETPGPECHLFADGEVGFRVQALACALGRELGSKLKLEL